VLANGSEPDPVWTLERLETLAGQNLIRVEPESVEPRFTMLLTIQEFAREALNASGEASKALKSHAACFARLALEAEPAYRGPGAPMWLARLEREHDNLRETLEWSSDLATLPKEESDERAKTGLQVAVALWQFWDQRGYESEARMWLETFHLLVPAADPRLRARALFGLGHSTLGDYERASTYYRESLAAWEETGDEQGVASALMALGQVSLLRGDYPAALAAIEDFVAIQRQRNDQDALAVGLLYLAHFLSEVGQFERALETSNQSRAIAEKIGDRAGVAWTKLIDGRTCRRLGDPVRARQCLDEALHELEAAGDQAGFVHCCIELARVVSHSEPEVARDHLDDVFAAIVNGSDAFTTLSALQVNAEVLVSTGNAENGIYLLAAVDSWRRATGTVVSMADRKLLERIATLARNAVGEARFKSAWSEGEKLSLRSAVALCIKRDRAT
jgi:tetratricopeptide (TPR) repeat protein